MQFVFFFSSRKTMSSQGPITVLRTSPGGIGQGNVQEARQQVVNIVVSYDYRTKTVHKQDATSQNSYVPKDGTQVFDILDSEPLYADATMPNSNPYGESFVLSALNGIGREAVRQFPNDPEMQRLVVKNSIIPKGFSVGEHREESGGQQKIASQTGGTLSPWYDEDIPEGSLVALDIPSKEEMSNPQLTNKKKGAPAGKVTPKVVAYVPKNIANNFATHVTNVLNRPQEYNQAMKLSSHTGVAPLYDASNAIFESQLMSFILGLYAAERSAGNRALVDGPGGLSPAQRAQRLAVGLGLVSDVRGATDSVGLTDAEKNQFADFRKELLNTINWTGNLQTAFEQVVDPALPPGQSVRLDSNTVSGQLVNKQANHWKRTIQAYNVFVHDDARLIVGKALSGAPAKSRGVILASV